MIVEARSVPARGASAARRLRERARRYLAALGREDAEVSVLVVDDAGIRRLNRKWRGKDEATDVLSFPQSGGAGPLLGDLVISLQTARRVARRDGRPVEAELDRYLAHGLLHLLGYDHARPADARKMAAAENALVGEGMIAASGSGVSGAEPPTLKTAKPAARSRQRANAPKALPPAAAEDALVGEGKGMIAASRRRSGSSSRSRSGSEPRSGPRSEERRK